MPDLLQSVRDTLTERYRIDRQIAKGSTAYIYLATDVRLERRVAVKVLLPELASSVSSERFLREIQIASKLTHPRILPLYDSGVLNGMLYYVMPFVDGETLRDRLGKGKQLALDDTFRITRDVASALDYAHSQDVIHRDVKPDNIMVFGGEAVVTDFGIARAMTLAGGTKLTETGMTLGTPTYMSPEQASGHKRLDGRADLYSLACVVYEMLAGHAPFLGSSAHEILLRHVNDPVPRLVAARPDVPLSVEAAILKAMNKKPGDRFATVAEFAAALTGEVLSIPPSRIRWRNLLRKLRRPLS